MNDESAGMTPNHAGPGESMSSASRRGAFALALALGFGGIPLIAFYIH